MPDVTFENLLLVSVVAVLAPLVLGYLPRLRVPSPVLEIAAGVVLGPRALGWVRADLPVQVLSLVGLSLLLFLSGLEIDARLLRGRALRWSLTGYAITLVLGLAIGLVLRATGTVSDPVLLAVTLSATSLGLVVPVLKDAGQLDTPIGAQIVVAASVADLAAIVLLSLLFATGGTPIGAKAVLLGGFVVMAGAVAFAARHAGRSMRLTDVLARLQDSTAQIRVRLVVVLVLGFVVFARRFGLESILGAFAAGLVVAALDRDSRDHPHLRTKLDAIGFGFLIPVFFVTSGIRLDLRGLLASPGSLALVPLFLGCLLLVRGLPALLYRHDFGPRGTAAAGLLQATSLPVIVTAGQIGVATGRLTSVTAAALVCAGLLSVLVFPAVALGQLRRAAEVSPAVSPAVR
jgi:Kef-type K+ transport system membrane component KefB